jgi:hypothetical protein
MTAAALHVHEPTVPEIRAGDLSKPLCCDTCGHELELRCGEGHLHTKNVGHLPPVPKVKTKQCPGCQQPFEPRRYQRRCDRCTPKKGSVAARAYREKPCASCGATFAPTGPRALRCEKCRGVV